MLQPDSFNDEAGSLTLQALELDRCAKLLDRSSRQAASTKPGSFTDEAFRLGP